jgi:hypothetical protein
VGERLRFQARNANWSRRVEVLVGSDSAHRQAVADPLTFRTVEDMSVTQTPTLEMSPEEATELMDALWFCGVRPTDDTRDDRNGLAATQAHLGDMRRLVFDARKEDGL